MLEVILVRSIRIELPDEMHQRIKMLATYEGTTVKDIVMKLIKEELSKYHFEVKKKTERKQG